MFMAVLWWSLFRYALLYVLSSFAIIFTRKASPHGAVGWSAVVIVIFPDHTHFCHNIYYIWASSRENLSSGF